MKQHTLMAAASILFLIGCTVGPTKEDVESEQSFLQKLRECGESSTLSSVHLRYTCRFLECEAKACAIKLCNPDQWGGVIVADDLEIDEARCRANFKPTVVQ